MPQLALRGLIRPAVLVHATTPLAEAIRQLTDAQAGALVTTDSAGRPTGIVSEAAVMAVPPDRRPWVPVNDVARPIVPELVLDVDLGGESLLAAISRLRRRSTSPSTPSGAVIGVLSAHDLEQHFSDV